MIQCYYTKIHNIAEERWSSLERQLCRQERRKQAAKYKVPADRHRCIAAGLLLQKVVGQERLEKLTIKYGEYGKPYFAGPGNIHFNISHSGDYVVCAVGPDENGIDVEIPQTDYMGIAKLCMTSNELDWLCEVCGVKRDLRFIRLWTLKESFVKMTGRGLHDELSDINVLPAIFHGQCEGNYFCEYMVVGAAVSVCSPGRIKTEIEEIIL